MGRLGKRGGIWEAGREGVGGMGGGNKLCVPEHAPASRKSGRDNVAVVCLSSRRRPRSRA